MADLLTVTDRVWCLEDDRQTVTVTFPTNPAIQIRFDVGGVTEMLQKLGDLRSQMEPRVEDGFLPGRKVQAIPKPAWVTEPELLAGDSLIHLRDPRYGWLHYVLPRADAKRLADHLLAQVQSPPPGSLRGKSN